MDKIKHITAAFLAVSVTLLAAHALLWVFFINLSRDGNKLTIHEVINKDIEDIDRYKDHAVVPVEYAELERQIRSGNSKSKQVFCIGDSWTYGIMVGGNENYPAQLQQYFPDYKIINLGDPGTTSSDAVKVARRFSVYFRKDDVVVVLAGMNDMASDFASWREERHVSRKEYFFSTYPWEAVLKLIAIDLEYGFDEMAAKKDTFQKNIESIVLTARSRGAIPLLLTYALPHNTSHNVFDPHDRTGRKYLVIDKIKEVGKRSRVTTIDLETVLNGKTDKNSYFLNMYNSHLNKKGYRLMAGSVAREIQALGRPDAASRL